MVQKSTSKSSLRAPSKGRGSKRETKNPHYDIWFELFHAKLIVIITGKIFEQIEEIWPFII